MPCYMASQIVNFSDCNMRRTLLRGWSLVCGGRSTPRRSWSLYSLHWLPIRHGYQSCRRQTNSATRVGQLGDNLFRLSVCFVLIEQNKLSKKAVLSRGNHAVLHLPHNISWAGPIEWVRIRRGGHYNTWYCSLISSGRRGAWLKAYSINSLQFLLLLLRLQRVPTVGVFLFFCPQNKFLLRPWTTTRID